MARIALKLWNQAHGSLISYSFIRDTLITHRTMGLLFVHLSEFSEIAKTQSCRKCLRPFFRRPRGCYATGSMTARTLTRDVCTGHECP